MALSAKDISLIDKYFEDELSESEKLSFSIKNNSSKDFAAEVELRITMIAALRLQEQEALKKEIKQEIKKSQLQKPVFKWYNAVAAAIACIALFTYLLLPSSDSLFETYYSPFPESPITRSESSEIDNYNLAMQYYSVGAFDKALKTFSDIKNDKDQDLILLYTGNCLIGLNRHMEAIESFKLLLESENEQIVMHARWLLSLSYIGSGQMEMAKEILTKSSAEENMYQKKSEDLLKKLDWVFY